MMSVSKNDGIKGLILFVLTALLLSLYNVFQTGIIPTTWAEWQPIVASAGSAMVAYVLKNFLTNSEDKFLISEPKA